MRHSLALCMVLAAGCGASRSGGTPTVGLDAGRGPGDPMDPMNPGGTDDGGSIDPGQADMDCGGMQFAIQRVPPNVLLILDRSGSMAEPIDLFFTPKWTALKNALNMVLGQFGAQMNLGASLFPDPNAGDSCAPGAIDVPVGPNHGAQVLAAVGNASPGGNTPTAATFDVVLQSGMLVDPKRDNYAVVATDGLPNCGDTDVAARITKLYNGKPSVKTYVIGVGAETAGNPQTLNDWAVAGHTDRAGLLKYYQANSPQDLQDAFTAIAGGVVSCTFALGQTPPDPMQLYVWENGKMVPADANNGFTYDPNTNAIVLHGAACDQLKQDPMAKVQVVYGCPGPPGIG